MNSKTILVFRDRPRLPFRTLQQSNILPHWAATVREAREEFERLTKIDAVIVDVQHGVERGLEFCEIVHITHPAVPIVFVRSAMRPGLEPRCAHRILDPDVSESDLEGEVLLLLENTTPEP